MAPRKVAVLAAGAAAAAAIAAFKIREHAVHRPALALVRSPLDPILCEGPAPEFAAPDADGKVHSLAELRGRHVLLNLWFSDCEPCRDEMPSLDALARRFAGRGIEVVALSVDPTWEKVRAFLATDPHLRARKPAFRLLLDPQKTVPPRYGTYKFPETFLIGPDGDLLARFVGPRDWSGPAVTNLIANLIDSR